MKWKKRIAPVLIAMSLSASALAETTTSELGLSLTVEANGHYEIAAAKPHWVIGGNIARPLSEVTSEAGQDKVGPYQLIHFRWEDGGRRSGSIRLYKNRPLVLFAVKYEDAVQGCPVAFPILTQLPENLLAFRYGETDHLRPELFHLAGSEPGEQYGGPFALFDDQANTMIFSPASNFMVAQMSGDLKSGISSGLNHTLTGVPAGYEQQNLLAIGPGINQTWSNWGHGLTDLYGKQRPAEDADLGLKYLGYWTDNGSYYYYNYDLEKGYIPTLLNVKDYLIQHQIPIHYMQLDSWWYPKTFDSFQKKEANKPRSKDPRLPAGSWNRYGGLLEFTAAKELFDDGLGGFDKQLGLPLIVHNRWIDPRSPYRADFKISGVAAVDPKWWDKICGDISNWGVITYEQDWNNWIYLKSPELSTTTWAGDAYMDGMAKGCADHKLTMQYCMVMPRFLMQGGAKYPNLTTVRVSGDRLERGKWHEFIYGSTLAGALGVWPWTDVYKSSETPNILLSSLSAGMVGISDKIGEENAENIFRAVRKDGVIIKPDVPLTPTDASFISEAKNVGGKNPGAIICCTRSGEGDQATHYVFAFTRDSKAESDIPWSIGSRSLELNAPAVAMDFFDHSIQLVDEAHPLGGSLNKERDWIYKVVAPIGKSGMAFLGDGGSFIMRGRQRVASVQDDGKTLKAIVLFSKGESTLNLLVYAPSRPTVESSDGEVVQPTWDEAAKLASVQIKVKQGLSSDKDGVIPVETSWHLQ